MALCLFLQKGTINWDIYLPTFISINREIGNTSTSQYSRKYSCSNSLWQKLHLKCGKICGYKFFSLRFNSYFQTRFWKSSELVCKSRYQPSFIEMQRLSEINHNFILKNRKISHVGGLFENLSVKSFKPKGIFTNRYGKNFLTKYFSYFKTKSIYGLRCTNLLQTERNL